MSNGDEEPSRSPLPAPDTDSARAPAGWYRDPFGERTWRWYDGTSWTAFASDGSVGSAEQVARSPRLPRWLSPPVLVCGVFTVLMLLAIAISSPWAVVAGLVPLLIVLPVLSWLDRVEPEPRSSKAHALLWGACVAVVVSSVVNATVVALFGELAAIVGSAPLVEEGAKALGIVWAVRRRDVDSVTDGIVYAGWVAIGFAVVEDMTYFAIADLDGDLLPVFVLRALMTPFAHPLFTFWTGLAIGYAVRQRRPIWRSALWGYGLAVFSHAAWNGSLVLSDVTYEVDENVSTTVILVAMAVFLVLFIAVAVTLIIMRGRERNGSWRAFPRWCCATSWRPMRRSCSPAGGATCCASAAGSSVGGDTRSTACTPRWRGCRCCTNAPGLSIRSSSACSPIGCRTRSQRSGRSAEQIAGDVDPELGRQCQAVDVDPLVVSVETVAERGRCHLG